MKRNTSVSLKALCLVFVGLLGAHGFAAALPETAQDANQGQSGYGKLPEFGGPESVGRQLKQADEDRAAMYRFDGLQRNLAPYFDWKRRINDEHSVALGFQFLY
jgi:hypothetical protein